MSRVLEAKCLREAARVVEQLDAGDAALLHTRPLGNLARERVASRRGHAEPENGAHALALLEALEQAGLLVEAQELLGQRHELLLASRLLQGRVEVDVLG